MNCSKCGAKVLETDRVCEACGYVLGDGDISLGSLAATLRIFSKHLVLPAVLLFILILFLSSLIRVHELPPRMTCGTNLSGIGKGMLIYSNDYDDKLPRAGADYNAWVDSLGGHGNAHGWQADDRRIAYAIDPKSGRGAVTTSASLYLLVKYAEVDPKYFICKGEKEMQEFRVKDWLPRGQRKELTELWDFGYFVNEKKNQTRHVSYSYHHSFGNSALTVDHEPGMAIAADRSPWCNSILDRDQRWSGFKPDLDPNTGTAEQERTGNSLAHHGEGQNVLFLDSHVAFKKRPFVGIANDNIYTVQDSDDPNSFLRGRMPVPYDAEASQPRNRRDSVLLQENGKGR